MALNAMDGLLAREYGMQSDLGAFLNEIGDVVSDAALYLPLALVPGFSPPLVVIVVFLAALTEMAGVVAAQIGARRNYSGPLGKSDRAFVLGGVSLMLGLGVPAGRWLTAVLMVMAVLLVITILNRCRRALEEVRK
jgi:CDP-diacylglycerol--glycerol-3-phosphate 3-phosphatidyltransferase